MDRDVGASETRNSRANFNIGSIVRFVGYNYTPDFIMMDEPNNEMGVILCYTRDGLRSHNDMYTVYWFKCGKTTKVPSAHLKLLSL